MKKMVILLMVPLLLTCISVKEEVIGTNGTVIRESFNSEAVTKSLLPQRARQNLVIYLPPSYYHTEKRYPVIYYLHGFGAAPGSAAAEQSFIDEAVLQGGAKEFIIVEPGGGYFYSNSPVSGNWEDYIVDELITYIDETYRTISSKEGRGIAGNSMGGTGAINIGFKYPDKFNGVYAFFPGLLKDGDLDILIESWGNNMAYFNAYGAVASPNETIEPPYAEIPNETYGDEAENRRVINNWYTIFGNQREKIDRYLERGISLAGIGINVDEGDYYTWIVEGCKDMHALLDEKNISHEFILTEGGGHYTPFKFTVDILIPFFSKHLDLNR